MRALVHDSDTVCELWCKRLGNLYYGLWSVVNNEEHGVGIARIQSQEGRSVQGLCKHVKVSFPIIDHRC